MNTWYDTVWKVSLEYPETKKDAIAILHELDKQALFAFDYETCLSKIVHPNGVFKGVPLGCSFCFSPEKSYYVPLYDPEMHGVFGDDLSRKYAEVLKGLIEDKNVKKIGHNIKYDIEVLMSQVGYVKMVNLEDTMIMCYLLDEVQPHGLKEMAGRVLGIESNKYEILLDAVVSMSHLEKGYNLEELYRYGAADSYLTFMAYKKFVEEDKLKPYSRLYEEVYLPAIEMLCITEEKGVKIDRKYVSEILKEYQDKAEASEKKIKELAGEPELNVNSTKQLSKLLFEKLKYVPSKKTHTGYSTDAESLELLKSQDTLGIVHELLEHRRVEKLKGTYIEPLLEQADSQGRVHGSYNLIGTVTGRLSASNPNLQNQPRDQKLRRAFVSEEGYSLVILDFSQIEVRLVALYANEPNLINAINSGADIHGAVAKDLFKLDCDANDVKKLYPKQRTAVKAIHFGILYGMGARSLAESIGETEKKAQEYIDAYYAKYAKLKEYQQYIREFLEANEYVESMFGRRRRFAGLNILMQSGPDEEEVARIHREAFNAIIQGSASDIVMLSAVHIVEELKKKYGDSWYKLACLVLEVHDEIDFEVRDDLVEEFIALEREVIDKLYKQLPVKIEFEIVVGKNWGVKA